MSPLTSTIVVLSDCRVEISIETRPLGGAQCFARESPRMQRISIRKSGEEGRLRRGAVSALLDADAGAPPDAKLKALAIRPPAGGCQPAGFCLCGVGACPPSSWSFSPACLLSVGANNSSILRGLTCAAGQ